MQSCDEIIFITTIGVNPDYKPCVWRLDNGSQYEGKFASVALENLLGFNGQCILLATKKALDQSIKNIEEIKNSFKSIKPDSFHILEIPDGKDSDECFEIAEKLINKIEALAGESRPKLVLDFTLSLRHLPFIYFCALTYLTGLKSFNIGGIYSGANELSYENTDSKSVKIAPIINLTSIFKLIQLYQAFIQVNKTGHFNSLSSIVDKDFVELFKNKNYNMPKEIKQLNDPLKRLAACLPAGLVKDIGEESKNLANKINVLKSTYKKESTNSHINLILNGFFQFEELINEWSLANKDFILNMAELSRELDLINSYIKFGYYQNAIILLREWYINFVILRTNTTTTKWLDKDYRYKFESQLNCQVINDKLKGQVFLWGKTRDIRNKFAHAFMKEDNIKKTTIKDDLGEIYNNCRFLYDNFNDIQLDDFLSDSSARKKILITPLGRSSGVLYSALIHFQPDFTIVITSCEAIQDIDKIITAVNNVSEIKFGQDDFKNLIMEDPFTGFNEFKSIYDSIENLKIINCENDIIINFTGGTTAMQFIVQTLAAKLSNKVAKITKKALIDKRSSVEQQNNPFELSQVYDLD